MSTVEQITQEEINKIQEIEAHVRNSGLSKKEQDELVISLKSLGEDHDFGALLELLDEDPELATIIIKEYIEKIEAPDSSATIQR